MKSMLVLRKNFRERVLHAIDSGSGDREALIELGNECFGEDVGVNVLIRNFLADEVDDAITRLREEGLIQPVGQELATV